MIERREPSALRALFDEATAQPSARRRAWLAETCDDARLRAEVEALLDEYESSNARDDPIDGDGDERIAPTPPWTITALGADAHPLVGSWLGEFRLRREIGRGGSGTVFEAEQRGLRRAVAVKVLHPGLTRPSLVARLQREARLASRLDHPNVGRVITTGTETTAWGTLAYIAMELVRGVPITEHAEARRLDVTERLAVLAPVLEAMQSAHDAGIVHRDLKPANVLVTDDGRPVIIDFGLARDLDPGIALDSLEATRTGFAGSIPWMSPEQLSRDTRAVGVRSDVYALGVLAYELLAGAHPFAAHFDVVGDLVDAVRAGRHAPLDARRSDVPAHVVRAVHRALSPDPRDRPSSPRAFGDALDGRPDTLARRTAGALAPVRRHPRRVVAVMVAAIVVLVLVPALRRWANDSVARSQLETLRAMARTLHPFYGIPRDEGMFEVQLDEAQRILERPLDRRLERDLCLVIGRVLINLGNNEDAVVLLERAERLDRGAPSPTSAEIQFNLAFALMRSARDDVDRRRALALARRSIATGRVHGTATESSIIMLKACQVLVRCDPDDATAVEEGRAVRQEAVDHLLDHASEAPLDAFFALPVRTGALMRDGRHDEALDAIDAFRIDLELARHRPERPLGRPSLRTGERLSLLLRKLEAGVRWHRGTVEDLEAGLAIFDELVVPGVWLFNDTGTYSRIHLELARAHCLRDLGRANEARAVYDSLLSANVEPRLAGNIRAGFAWLEVLEGNGSFAIDLVDQARVLYGDLGPELAWCDLIETLVRLDRDDRGAAAEAARASRRSCTEHDETLGLAILAAVDPIVARRRGAVVDRATFDEALAGVEHTRPRPQLRAWLDAQWDRTGP